MRHHPSTFELFEYAEASTSSGSPISVQVASHVSACRRCAGKVEGMRASLAVANSVEELEPSAALTARIVHGCRQVREDCAEISPRRRSVWVLAKGLAAAAFLVVAGSVSFGIATAPGVVPEQRAAEPIATAPASPVRPVPETLQRVRQEIESLTVFSDVVQAAQTTPRSVEEERQLGALRAVQEELRDALLTLEEDPANMRAWQVLDATRGQQDGTLRPWQIERTL